MNFTASVVEDRDIQIAISCGTPSIKSVSVECVERAEV
jgi:hypothetical protein